MDPQNLQGPSQQRAPVWMAPVFAGIGLCIIALACDVIHVDPQAFHAPRWVVACAGSLFCLVGLLIASQDQPASLHVKLLAAMFFSMFAAVFGWVGFGPGPRAFSTTTVVLGVASRAASSERSGRIVFASVAVIVGVAALAAWWRLMRSLLGPRSD
ncbi:MAG: hypothetical protein JO299_05960 [Gammaproteobacteria bacterium]|nr:hypothetical protein [Gammaproteobacteria bacterium]